MDCARLHGQTSIEFIYTLGFMMLFFSAMLGVFMLAQSDLTEVGWRSESRALCHSASSQISTLVAAGEGASASLSLPQMSAVYTVRVSGPARLVTVSGDSKMASCPIATSNITNGTSSEFPIDDKMRATSTNGGVAFG